MGLGSKFRQAMRSFEDESRRMAKYTLAAGGAMMGGASGASAGYQFGSALDDRKYSQQSGTDLGKLRRNAIANGFNPLTVLRATGGQGFYHNQVPMGRLSSDAFFNAFDAYERKQNKNAPVIEEPKMTGKDILAPVELSNGKLNSDQNTAIYDVVQDPITLEYVTDGNSVFSANQKPGLFVEVDHRGNKWRFPWEDLEWDQVTLGSYKWLLQEAYYQGDRIGKSMRKKLGKKFGIYGYKADKQTIGNTIKQLDKLQKQMSIKNEKILVTPILQQQKIMEELFP
jgi:hypothetical protein